MTTKQFRCENCDKLLATFTGSWNFAPHTKDQTYVVAGSGQSLEIKCSRCKCMNKRVLSNEEAPFTQVSEEELKRLEDIEAPEAHNEVSGHERI